MLPAISVQHISGNTPAWQIGLCAKEGGIIVKDTPLNFYFKSLFVGDAGDVLVRGVDGNIIPYRGVLSGATLYVLGNEVVGTATVDGVALTTTATNITWQGGF